MDKYRREYPLFSLCGLNCGLCPMHHISEESHCTGCGGEGRPSCAILRCARQHGGVEYCFRCEAYPCERYSGQEAFDSFVPKRFERDFALVQQLGLPGYQAMLTEKMDYLRVLLRDYNDGRCKSFFCTAVNQLSPEDVRTVMKQIRQQIKPEASQKEKAAMAVKLIQNMAEQRSVSLKLRRKKT